MNNNQNSFVGYLHTFRGFAIINIVLIHAIGLTLFFLNDNSDITKNPYDIVNELLFHNSTIYFAIISGLLFSVVLKSKGYKHFYISKFKNVFLPYLFLTFLFSIFNPTPDNFFALHSDFRLYLQEASNNLLFGKAQFTYWYLPVLIFLYLVTPALDYIMNIKKYGSILIILIALIPLAISRVELADVGKENHLYITTMIYFMGAYAAGMFFGSNLDERLKAVKKNMRLISLITLVSSVALVYFGLENIDKFGAWSLRSTLFYIQKMCLSAIFIILFKNRSESQPRLLKNIANYSFTIYFLHVFFLLLLYGLLMPLSTWNIVKPFKVVIFSFIFFTASIAMSILVGWLLKKLLGKYSKMFVGS